MVDNVKVLIYEQAGTELEDAVEYDLKGTNLEFETPVGMTSTDVHNAILEAGAVRSGKVLFTAFSGSPKTATVTFTTALPDTNYIVTISGIDARLWSFESTTTTGFVINANANKALTGDVHWTAKPVKDIG